MQVVEIFLPVLFPNGDPVPPGQLELVRSELTEKFGGVTAYSRSPALGEWKSEQGIERDDIVILEVMVDKTDDEWWTAFRLRLERTFHQEQLLIRTHKASRL